MYGVKEMITVKPLTLGEVSKLSKSDLKEKLWSAEVGLADAQINIKRNRDNSDYSKNIVSLYAQTITRQLTNVEVLKQAIK
jgi:hypothetical protein